MNLAARNSTPRSTEEIKSFLEPTIAYIKRTQNSDGSLPWFKGGITDPWDHIEATMGLTVGGEIEAAQQALRWLFSQQREDGAWFAAYRDGEIADTSRAESNFVAYVATGLWHFYKVTGDEQMLRDAWPNLVRAMDFIQRLQSPFGEIYWAVDARTGISHDALVTGCASIYKSFACAISIAELLRRPQPRWIQARKALGEAVRNRPERFDRTWESKQRYSMDWFYPVMCGVLPLAQANHRIDQHWHRFVEPGIGCRCVADRPWVTVAETCELIMALCAIDRRDEALALFADISQQRVSSEEESGAWWTGYEFKQNVFWPDEKPTWTSAAVILAADALYDLTPASDIFRTTAEVG